MMIVASACGVFLAGWVLYDWCRGTIPPRDRGWRIPREECDSLEKGFTVQREPSVCFDEEPETVEIVRPRPATKPEEAYRLN